MSRVAGACGNRLNISNIAAVTQICFMVERSLIRLARSTAFERAGRTILRWAMDRPEPTSEKQRAALRDLDRLRRERDMLHGLFARTSGYFTAAEVGNSDPIERWGRRIGRALGALAFVGLCVYLYLTYAR